ncbi:nucleoside hydrolase [Nocardioides sp. SYSU DS0651]|uniref:nucleoside hydrolase n=1 Tax=Nocardioides sp. SYSU DS0651 TaxID=3415955 RepID=UPI003F4C3AEB
MTGLPVILDCDTGTDDAVAILLAALHPDLELLGVTTVWGNHDVRHTTDNTLRVLDLVGRGDVGVHPGRNAPVRPRIEPLPSGRADLEPTIDLPAPVSAPAGDAVDWLVETLRAAAEPVALVATGPLTNLAAALAADRRLVASVGRLVVLGGSHRRAGVTPYAERNVWCDPEAAGDVLAARWRDLLLVTMDATFAAPLTGADAARLRALGTPAAVAAASLVEQRIGWYRSDPAMAAAGGAPLHDPLAVAALVAPELLTVLRAGVTVERSDPTTYGATRFTAEVDDAKGAAAVAVAADRVRYVDLLCSVLGGPAARPAQP